nr:hypothetical protein [Streptomyces antimycoticus]
MSSAPSTTSRPHFRAGSPSGTDDNIGAVDLTQDDEATTALDKVSAPISGGYPYDAFGTAQRDRWRTRGPQTPDFLLEDGSDHPPRPPLATAPQPIASTRPR